ncbi:MAG: YdcF family protein [Robiginitomaculum sp.]
MVRRKPKAEKPPKTKLQNFIGFIRFLILLGALLIVSGFTLFVRSVSNAAPPNPVPSANGIVILTGDSGRMRAGGALLEAGKAERLLVSGVAPQVSHDDLLNLLAVSEANLDCCVDVDSAAKDTLGNARETAIWANALGYEHIILVTSDYHMARAKLELTTATGGIRITPYPVAMKGRTALWKDSDRFKLLWREYAKLLVIYLRDTGARPDHAPNPSPSPNDAMSQSQAPDTLTPPAPQSDSEEDSP